MNEITVTCLKWHRDAYYYIRNCGYLLVNRPERCLNHFPNGPGIDISDHPDHLIALIP